MKYYYIIYILFIILYVLLRYKKDHFNNSTKNILVMFSGGLDSTTALYKLLKETKHNIFVHHIILKDRSNRWKHELQACKNIVSYLKKIRPFNEISSPLRL